MNSMENTRLIVKQLKDLLKGEQTYVSLEDILKRIRFEDSGKSVTGLPYTVWQLMQHIRISQKDILDFSIGSDYHELKWPDDFWVKEKAPKDVEELEECKKQILLIRDQMIRLVEENDDVLLEKIPHGNGQTLMREAMITAEHTAYHAGEIVVMMRILGVWEKS
jgi:uncharacterized damage-inducible protein DinB